MDRKGNDLKFLLFTEFLTKKKLSNFICQRLIGVHVFFDKKVLIQRFELWLKDLKSSVLTTTPYELVLIDRATEPLFIASKCNQFLATIYSHKLTDVRTISANAKFSKM